MYDVTVIGGGAAGMLAAALCARGGKKTLLLERNDKTGRKLSLTGKGRCNLTNNCTADEVIANIPTGGRFLQSALHAFPPSETIKLFSSLGVPLKTERGNRVFPVSDRALDIVFALTGFMKKTGVAVRQARVEGLETADGAVTAVIAGGGRIPCGAAILSTGGVSYPATGSTGDGYAIAEALGHTVIPPKASLVPLIEDGDTCNKLQGLSLKNAGLRVFDGGKKPVYTDFGELLFTHFGLSGPLILSASAHLRDFGNKRYTASIDLKPALDAETLDRRLLRDFGKFANRDIINALDELLPRLIIPVIIAKAGIAPDKKVNAVTKEERARLNALLKNFSVEIAGPASVDEAIITSGGIETRQVEPKTLQSKLVRGLYFAGEVLDCDAYTGGFNLQIAWATAFAAARGVLDID
jgi:predicted Rossmann fold flavoprotein